MKKTLNQQCLCDITMSRENAHGSGFLPGNEMLAWVAFESPLQ